MKFFVAVTLALLVGAFAVSVPWKSCATGADHLKISSVDLIPDTPSPGKPVTIKFVGDLDKAISGGVTHLEVAYLGIKILSKDFDTCTLSPEFPCPIKAGHLDLSITETIPAVTPRGSYTGKVQMWDQDRQEVTCVTFAVKIQYGLDDYVLDSAMIDVINARGEWKAAHNARFDGMTVREAQKLLGLNMERKPDVAGHIEITNPIPDTFDARQQWPNCVHPIRDQAHCGSCWAFALTEVMSDRFCISSQGTTNVVLSPQYVLSCDKSDMCCDGGYIDRSWNFMVSTGTVTDQCWPYESGAGACPACRTTCKDGAALAMYKVKSGSVLHPTGVAAIQTAIMTYGPVEAGFQVYQDFFSYHSGVYHHVSGTLAGGHAIKVIGWGVESGTPYWLCANSWGTSWAGLGGFFKILRGKDECQIESWIYEGLPQL